MCDAGPADVTTKKRLSGLKPQELVLVIGPTRAMLGADWAATDTVAEVPVLDAVTLN